MKTRSPAMKTMAILTRSALLTGLCLPWLAAAQGTAGGGSAGLPVVQAGEQGLTVNAFASMLVSSDELVRAQLLEAAIAEQSVRGAKAVYEPFFTTSLTRDGKLLPTTAEEYFSRGGGASGTSSPVPYESQVTQFKTAVALKGSSGADWELSYNLDSIVNSLQPKLGGNYISPEYRGSLGFSLTQPLLRNFGRDVTESGIRIAERERAIASETVRQMTAQRLNEGLQTYLFVQRAQQRVRWRQQALNLALQLEQEISRQQLVGLKSNNELTEVRATLALRRVMLAQAQQDLEEQLNSLQVFFSANPNNMVNPQGSRWIPSDELSSPAPDYADSLKMTDAQTAFAQRPETRVIRQRIEREEFRRLFAKNQTEPELNLKLRYGKESLMDRPLPINQYLNGTTPYNAWGIGVTFRIGLDGDARKDSEYQTAVLRKSQAELSLGATQQRIVNELQGMKVVLERAMQQAARQAEVVTAQSELLKAERRMMAEGQKSLLDVLRRGGELALAQEALTDAIAQVNRSSYVASQVNGGLLARFKLE